MKWPLLCSLLITTCSAWSDPVWHCSRNVDTEKAALLASQENQFYIASFNSSLDVIGVSISDLIDVYSGVPVRIGGLPLSACFRPGDAPITSEALTSLGLQPSAVQALARKSTIIHNHLHLVTSDKQMLSCIAQHFPAVGYLHEPNETEAALPCF